MRFEFTEEQRLFQRTVRDLLEKECPAAQVRAAWENPSGRVPGLWERLAGLGVIGLTVPEEHGGLGMNELDLVLVLEETGRAAAPEPIVETTAVAAPLLRHVAPPDLQARWLPAVARGEAVVGVGVVGTPFVLDAHQADLLILERDDELHAVDPAETTLEQQPSVDGSRRLFSVGWAPRAGTVIASQADGWQEVNAAFDRGALAVAAQLVGLAACMIDMSVEYATERRQFGAPIGSFQAVKHRLADALLALEFARPVVYRAAHSVAQDLSDRSRDVSMAKVHASEAALVAAGAALQCHGAIGYTVEYDLHLWMKRAWALASSWGDPAWHRERVAVAVLGPGS